VLVIVQAHHLYHLSFQSLIESDFIIEIHLFTNSTGVDGSVDGLADGIDVLGVSDVLGDTSLNLGERRLDDTTVHHLNLLLNLCVVVTSIIDEDHTHDTVEVVGVLVVDGDTSLVLESLADATLEKIFVKIRKKESVQGSFTLLERIKVEIVTHLI